TFSSREDISKVCVIFYDVHGGGTRNSGLFQHVLAGNTGQIAVNGNHDNSVSTNRFNPRQGANCVGFPFLDHTSATTDGEFTHDTAFIHGAALGQVTFVQFHLFGPGDSTCSGADLYSGPRKEVTGNGSMASNNFTLNSAGTFHWTADLFDRLTGGMLLSSTHCGDTGETIFVEGPNPDVTTDAGDDVVFAGNPPGNDLTDHATLSGALNPIGSITFELFGPNDATCAGPRVGSDNKNVNGNGQYTGTVQVTAPGAYRWVANYSGDPNNDPTTNGCNEPNEDVTVFTAS
ncbi:MAG: hypothetical protein ACJ77A_10315, partial [Actinomycetota bacterium]